MLKILSVSLSGFKAWRKRKTSKIELRRNQIKEEIVDIYDTSYQNYGAPKITAELRKNVEIVSERIVGKYMNEIGVKAQLIKPYTRTTVNPNFTSSFKILSMSSLILIILPLYGAAILHIFVSMNGLYI